MKDSTESAEPGNYGVGFPTFLGKVEDPETRKSKLAAELANGRLAMMVTWLLSNVLQLLVEVLIIIPTNMIQQLFWVLNLLPPRHGIHN